MLVSTALSLMLTLGAGLVAPDGCEVVAVWDDGSAAAECADGETWFVYDPDITADGMWSLVRHEPTGLVELRQICQRPSGDADHPCRFWILSQWTDRGARWRSEPRSRWSGRCP